MTANKECGTIAVSTKVDDGEHRTKTRKPRDCAPWFLICASRFPYFFPSSHLRMRSLKRFAPTPATTVRTSCISIEPSFLYDGVNRCHKISYITNNVSRQILETPCRVGKNWVLTVNKECGTIGISTKVDVRRHGSKTRKPRVLTPWFLIGLIGVAYFSRSSHLRRQSYAKFARTLAATEKKKSNGMVPSFLPRKSNSQCHTVSFITKYVNRKKLGIDSQ